MSAKPRKLRMFFEGAMQKTWYLSYTFWKGGAIANPVGPPKGSQKPKNIVIYDVFLLIFPKNIVFYDVFGPKKRVFEVFENLLILFEKTS